MTERSLRHATLDDVAAVAALHADRIAEGFLVTFGPRFLRRLYRRIVLSPAAFALVATDGSRVHGFIAVADDTRRFYREFLRHDAVGAAFAAAPALLRAPRRAWETLRYGVRTDESLPAAEVLAIAVDDATRGSGLGAGLAVAAVEELRRRGVRAARVVTAIDNVPARRSYDRAGFRHAGFTEVHRAVRQEVLVWP